MGRLSIIVPTIGRPTLRATLGSIADQWDGEQVIVLTERGHGETAEVFRDLDPGIKINAEPAWMLVQLPEGPGCWGHDLRNFALNGGLVRGSHVATIDDDDIYVDGALAAMAEAVADDAPVAVFKARWGAGHPANGVVLWSDQRVAKGNVATPMIVARRSEARYGLDYFGDYQYAVELLLEFPPHEHEWVWDERVICEVRPVAVEVA